MVSVLTQTVREKIVISWMPCHRLQSAANEVPSCHHQVMFFLLKILSGLIVVWHGWLHSNRPPKPTSWGGHSYLTTGETEDSLFQVLKPQVISDAPMPPAPNPTAPANIWSLHPPYCGHVHWHNLPQATLLKVSSLCARWSPRSPSATHGASLHLCIALYQEPSLALRCLCSIPDNWLQLYLSSSFYYPLTNIQLLICHVLSGLLTNGLLSACNTFQMIFSFYSDYLGNSLSRRVPTNGNSSIIPPISFNLCYWIFPPEGPYHLT